MKESSDSTVKIDASATGLCATCLHARRIESARGSVFFLCELSVTDPRFPKYPRLPVLSCEGYVDRNPAPHTPVSS